MSDPTPSLDPQAKASDAPFLRFYHSDTLRTKTLTILSAVEAAKDPTRHRSQLADLVMELTNSGMDYYFMRPLKLAKVGFVVEQSASMSLSGSIRVLAGVIHNIIGRMNGEQLLLVCKHIRELMT